MRQFGEVGHRILEKGDVEAGFKSMATGSFDAGLRCQPREDDLLDTMVTQLLFQICINKRVKHTMLTNDNFTFLRS